MSFAGAGEGIPPSRLYRAVMERLPILHEDILRAGGAIAPLRFNAAQEKLWEYVAPALDASARMRYIILKARREGVSTFFSALTTAIACLNDNVQAMVVAQDKTATERIWGMSKLFMDGSPLKALGKASGHTLSYRGSRITLSTAGSPETARSGQLTIFHGSEAAFWPHEEALVAILQCLPRRRDVFSLGVIESTANGMVEQGALYYAEWQRAVRGETSYVPIFLPWQTFPDYCDDDDSPFDLVTNERYGNEEVVMRDLGLSWGQMRWRRMTIDDDCQGNLETWNQEYPATPEAAFIMTGHPLFTTEDLLWCEPFVQAGHRGMLEVVHGRITFKPSSTGALTIFKRPEPGHRYIIGADSAMGLEGGRHSKSAAEVFDLDTLEQVAEYEGTTSPHTFARHLALLGRVYNMALLVPEVQSSGGGGGREMVVFLTKDCGYYNIHRWKRVDKIRRGEEVLYGWETNSQTRPRMIARLKEHIEERSVVIHSRPLLTQLRCFGENDVGRLEALAGYDDLFMAMGIAITSRSENWVAQRNANPIRQEDRVDLDRMGYSVTPDVDVSDMALLSSILAGRSGHGVTPNDFMGW